MTDEELTNRFNAIDTRFDEIKSDIKKEGADTQAFIKQEAIATRSRFDIIAEALTSDITLIASGHESLVDSHAKLDVAQQRLEARQDGLGNVLAGPTSSSARTATACCSAR